MTWVKIEDRWPFDRKGKAIAAGPLARDLYVCALAFCAANLTDGHIPDHVLPQLAPGNPRPSISAKKLVEVGLWEEESGGWHVHDYHDYNPTADEVKERRRGATIRMNRWRQKREGDASTPALSRRLHGVGDAAPDPTRPTPPTPPWVERYEARYGRLRDLTEHDRAKVTAAAPTWPHDAMPPDSSRLWFRDGAWREGPA